MATEPTHNTSQPRRWALLATVTLVASFGASAEARHSWGHRHGAGLAENRTHQRTAAGDSHTWSTFRDPLSGASIDFPSDLFSVDAGAPATGSGKVFQTDDGRAQLSLYAIANERNETPSQFLKNHLTVDKQTLRDKHVTNRSFNFAGLLDDRRFITQCNFSDKTHYIDCILLQYPKDGNKLWTKIAARVSRSLHEDGAAIEDTEPVQAKAGSGGEAAPGAVEEPAANHTADLGSAHTPIDSRPTKSVPISLDSDVGDKSDPDAGRSQSDKPNDSSKPNDTDSPADQSLGQRFHFDPESLASPETRALVSNPPVRLPYNHQQPRVPDGFTVVAFATGLANPRRLLVLPNGDVLVAEQSAGYLTLLRDQDGDGRADFIERHAAGFNQPYGLAWRDNAILVADQNGIWTVPHRLGAVRPQIEDFSGTPPGSSTGTSQEGGQHLITPSGAFGLAAGHRNRPLIIDSTSGALFVGVGSSGNIGIEPAVKATIQRFDADGSHQRTFATGLRNPTALAFHPQTGELFAVVQERDGLGDNLPGDYLTHIEQDAFYGWPYAYIGPHPQSGFAERAPEKVNATKTPDLLFQAHSSALDLVFYRGDQFPAEYRNSAFVALKGSWNRTEPTGYKVVRVPFRNGRPEGFYENFVTGFWASGTGKAEVWGRPAALAVTNDGALLVADDTGGTIWRISYTGLRHQAGTPEATPFSR